MNTHTSNPSKPHTFCKTSHTTSHAILGSKGEVYEGCEVYIFPRVCAIARARKRPIAATGKRIYKPHKPHKPRLGAVAI